MPKRVNRLHFFQRFDPTKDFIAIKIFSTGGVSFSPGDKFDFKKLKMPLHKVRAMWNARKIAYTDALFNPANMAAVVEENQPKIVKGAFGWIHIEKDGEKISKSTKSMEEAEEWLEAAL